LIFLRLGRLLLFALSLVADTRVTLAADRIILQLREFDGGAVELFLSTPRTPGPHPAILFVHGHQEPQRPGGRVYVDAGRLDRMARAGFVAASVSQSGYGGSDGPADFCGPRTQAVIRAALAHLRGLPSVEAGKIVLYGVSRGAIAGAMVAADELDLRAVILVSGTYDLAAAFPTGNRGLDANIAAEAGTTAAALAARSALPRAQAMRAATLILHGRNDDRAPVAQAEQLAAALARHGVPVRLKLFDAGHMIPIPQQWQEIEPFLAEALR
jgi:dipeptidyl aminopeptidase/acylaminoacyl peptidase